MALNINLDIFCNPLVREAVETISKVASKRHLGIKRWDNVLDTYKFSGSVVIPIKLGTSMRVFRDPFYFIIEKVNDQESVRIKPVEGDQWSIGDVYGFFGLHDFADYKLDMPIFVVEGLSDWAAVKKYYKYTLASLSAWLTARQLYFLSEMSKVVFIGWDLDSTGNENAKISMKKLESLGGIITRYTPAEKDWGKMIESDFGKELLHRQMIKFIDITNTLRQ